VKSPDEGTQAVGVGLLAGIEAAHERDVVGARAARHPLIEGAAARMTGARMWQEGADPENLHRAGGRPFTIIDGNP
jgi:hypothetical protein